MPRKTSRHPGDAEPARCSHHMKTIAMLLAFLVSPVLVRAGDFHLTPAGAGNKDGTSWQDAFDQKALGSVVNERMQPGDRLLLAGGIYANAALVISKGGSQGLPKTIAGVDRGEGLPVFSGTWSVESPTKGATAVNIEPGVSHVVVEGLRIKGCVFGVRAPAVNAGTPRSHLVFNDVDIEQCRHGFYLADCDDLQLNGCDLKRYSKHAFRFDQGCDRVTVRQCTADCSEGDAEWEKKTELFPFGFTINDGGAPNTAFVFEDCLSRNNVMPLQKTKYKNGDGFVVEGNTSDVAFVRCRSIRNQDGGFDLKVRDVQLTGCVAIGNSRNYRIWTTGTLTNCFSGWAKTGLWCNGGPVSASRCTFHELKDSAVLSDDRATLPVTLSDCIISSTGKPSRKSGRGEVAINATVVADSAKPESDPKYVHPDPAWDGLGGAMDSRAYPDKGYRRVER